MCICLCAHIAERWLQRSIIVLKLQSNQNTHKRARGDTLHVLCHQSHFSFCYDSTTSHRHNKTLDRLKIRIILKMPEVTTNTGCRAGTSGEQRWREKVWMDEAPQIKGGKLLVWLAAQHLCSLLIINQNEGGRKNGTEETFSGSSQASSSTWLPEKEKKQKKNPWNLVRRLF